MLEPKPPGVPVRKVCVLLLYSGSGCVLSGAGDNSGAPETYSHEDFVFDLTVSLISCGRSESLPYPPSGIVQEMLHTLVISTEVICSFRSLSTPE